MISIIGIQINLPPQLSFLGTPLAEFLVNLAAWGIIAALIYWSITPLLKKLMRTIPGEVEDIVFAIIRRPISFLLFFIGFRLSIPYLEATEKTERLLIQISMTFIILFAGHIIGKIIRDVLVYYGGDWARRTESQVDDILLPVLSLFGPLVLILVAALLILPMWGVDVSSVLLGAGVLGLVLGLALQETLSNIFSGLSLLIEAPFRRGDLIRLTNGKVCEVQRLGLRSTTLLSLDEQSTIFMPNKLLAADMLINLTKPTAEQRYSIPLTVAAGNDISVVKEALYRIALGHPAVLVSEISSKIPKIHALVDYLRANTATLSIHDPIRAPIEMIADNYEFATNRLEHEAQVNTHLILLEENIRTMVRGIRTREMSGISRQEILEIKDIYFGAVEKCTVELLSHIEKWISTRDFWLKEDDYRLQKKIWHERSESLTLRWENLKKCVLHPDESMELRLDDQAEEMIEWLNRDFKLVHGIWKNPMAEVTSVSTDEINLELHYYVDNIRLEMDGRPRRVRSELNQLIRYVFIQEGIWS